MEGRLREGDAGGQWDMYVLLASRFGYAPQQVDRFDPDFVDELLAYMEAESKMYANLAKG